MGRAAIPLSNVNDPSGQCQSGGFVPQCTSKKPTLQAVACLSGSSCMLNKSLAALLLLLMFLVAGCATNFTNLTPQQQERNANNLYPVEVALDSRQQTLRWQSIRPQIVVG